MSAVGTKYDGNFDEPSQHGAIVPMIDPISRGRLWKQTMMQRAKLWAPIELDTEGPLDEAGVNRGFLIEETGPTSGGGDLVTWDRLFAEVPETLVLPQSFAHSYQLLDGTKITELTKSVSGLVVWDYFLAPDPRTIPILLAYRIFNLPNGSVVDTGTAPADGTPPGTTGYIVTVDSQLERYHGAGNIWCRKTSYVPPLVYTAHV